MRELPELFSSIDGTVTNVDGTTHEFTINPSGEFSQWGADHDHLVAAWDVLKAMAQAVGDQMCDPEEWREEREDVEHRQAFFCGVRSGVPDRVWEAHGFECAIIDNPVPAGYIALPPDHPWSSLNLQAGTAVNPKVHGGVTFGPALADNGSVIIGWDAAHAGDASAYRPGRVWLDDDLVEETEKLAEQAKEARFEPVPYRKRQERVEVMQVTAENYLRVAKWSGAGYEETPDSVLLCLERRGVRYFAGLGDYAVKAPDGEFGLFSADAFAEVFEPLDLW